MSSSDSESDVDDVPLSSLVKTLEDGVSEAEEKVRVKMENVNGALSGESMNEDDEEDDIPISSLKRTKAELMDDGSQSDESDDVPLSQVKVKKERKETPKKKKVRMENNVKSERTLFVKRETGFADINTIPKRKKKGKIQFKQTECSEVLYKTEKGALVQKLLCRWWYVVEWPPKDAKYEIPPGHQELDGFKGSFICVKGDEMGTIIDQRYSADKPSFINFFSMPAEKLQELVIKAYKKQMEVLIEHEGEDSPLLKELKKGLKAVTKVNTSKADKEAKGALKAFKYYPRN